MVDWLTGAKLLQHAQYCAEQVDDTCWEQTISVRLFCHLSSGASSCTNLSMQYMEHVHYLHCTLKESSNCSCVDLYTNMWEVQLSSLLQPKPRRLWKGMAEARSH